MKLSFLTVLLFCALALVVVVGVEVEAQNLILSTKGVEDQGDTAGYESGEPGTVIPTEAFQQDGGLFVGKGADIGSVEYDLDVEVTDDSVATTSHRVASEAIASRERIAAHRLNAARDTHLKDEEDRESARQLLLTLQDRYADTGDTATLEEMQRIMLLLGEDRSAVAVSDERQMNRKAVALAIAVLAIAVGVLAYRRWRKRGGDADVATIPATQQDAGVAVGQTETAAEDETVVKEKCGVAQQPKRRRKRRRKGNRQKQQQKNKAAQTAQVQTS